MDSVIKASAISVAHNTEKISSVSRLLDVGGGSGAFATAITEVVEDLEAVVLDLPTMCHQTKKYLKKSRKPIGYRLTVPSFQ